ncbi:ATP-binding protein [Paenibacillus sp. HWE-109]|uniref:ATP-binding protein n=1 Tax=Paenibacillus sp. HWE-109 TaxID=1306526 RepID=UPI001EDCB788|nr:ATP-binding protein [Paenibacillus sp. HWE-109]UKS25951.1 ATP-binding protein [Paenibacillus sp. HWE-109]
MDRDLQEFEVRSGLTIKDKKLFELAFTHSSYLNEHHREAMHENERLIDLGKELTHLIIAEFSFTKMRGNEGALSHLMTVIKARNLYGKIVSNYGMRDFFRTGKGQPLEDIKDDAIFYPVIGAMYLEHSYEKCVEFVFPLLQQIINDVILDPITDWKSALQNWSQRTPNQIKYEVNTSGVSHQQVFHCVVTVAGLTETGVGSSKKKAENEAAKAYFQHYIPRNIWLECTSLKDIKIVKDNLPDLIIPKSRLEQLQPLSMVIKAGPLYLHQSLTHRSYLNENRHAVPLEYGTLAYLGSYVLSFFFTKWSYERFYFLNFDRKLSTYIKIRASLMQEGSIGRLYNTWGLVPYTIMGKGQHQTGITDAIRADIVQALIASIFLTQRECRADDPYDTLIELLQDHMSQIFVEFQYDEFDPKTRLQEMVQSFGSKWSVSYNHKQSGKAHEPSFLVTCHISGPNEIQYPWTGSGPNIKDASHNSAYSALRDIKQAVTITQGLSDLQKQYKPMLLSYFDQILNNINITPAKLRWFLQQCGSLGIETMLSDKWVQAYKELSVTVSFLSALAGTAYAAKMERVLSRFQSFYRLKYTNAFLLSEYLVDLLLWLKQVTPYTPQKDINPFLSGIVDTLQVFRLIDKESFKPVSLKLVLEEIWPLMPRQLVAMKRIEGDVGEIYGNKAFLDWLLYSLLAKIKERRLNKLMELQLKVHASRLSSRVHRIEFQFDGDLINESFYSDISGLIQLAALSFAEVTSEKGSIRIDFLSGLFEGQAISDEDMIVESIFSWAHRTQLNAIQELGPLGGIIHDLKNALILLKKLLPTQPSGNEDYSIEFVTRRDNLTKTAESLASLFAKREPNFHNINLLEFMGELSRKIKGIANQKCIVKFAVNLYNDEIVSDSAMIHSIILNLTKNAIESVSPEEGRVQINVSLDDDQLLLRITDNGKGIPKERMPDLFSSFFTTKSNGNGLGLPTVKRMVDLLDGLIEVESNHEEGTSFKIFLPTEGQRKLQVE